MARNEIRSKETTEKKTSKKGNRPAEKQYKTVEEANHQGQDLHEEYVRYHWEEYQYCRDHEYECQELFEDEGETVKECEDEIEF